MKHTKEQALEKTKQVLKDLDIDYYFEDSFDIDYLENNEEYIEKYDVFNLWKASVEVPDEQFDGQKGLLIIAINDENLEPFRFLDISGGQIPPVKISKKNGKYQLGE